MFKKSFAQVAQIARTATVALAVSAGAVASAQAPFPSKPIEISVGFSPGGSVDLMARGIAEEMAVALGQPVIVRNVEGASGVVAMKLLTSRPADGYALVFGPETTLIGAIHTSKPGYQLDAFDPVCQVFRNTITIAVMADSPYRTIQDLLAAMEKRPGALSYGHTGRGSVIHITVANLLAGRKLSAVDVPYRGESAIVPALISGDIAFGTISSVTASNQRGKLSVLATLDDHRDPFRPDVPSMGDLGASSVPPVGLNGLYARKGTPPQVLAALQGACQKATLSARYQEHAKNFNTRLEYLPAEGFRKGIEADYTRIGELIRTLQLGDLN